eukprot:GHVL01019373.1.p1 GENE.GHVL01019373.1~~GHVL01019373.1.p1  ORF type:complete len:276 (+),score=70.90 GHVL01019373.1:815-1642(+)
MLNNALLPNWEDVEDLPKIDMDESDVLLYEDISEFDEFDETDETDDSSDERQALPVEPCCAVSDSAAHSLDESVTAQQYLAAVRMESRKLPNICEAKNCPITYEDCKKGIFEEVANLGSFCEIDKKWAEDVVEYFDRLHNDFKIMNANRPKQMWPDELDIHHWSNQRWSEYILCNNPETAIMIRFDCILTVKILRLVTSHILNNIHFLTKNISFWIFSLLVTLDRLTALQDDCSADLQVIRRQSEKLLKQTETEDSTAWTLRLLIVITRDCFNQK